MSRSVDDGLAGCFRVIEERLWAMVGGREVEELGGRCGLLGCSAVAGGREDEKAHCRSVGVHFG